MSLVKKRRITEKPDTTSHKLHPAAVELILNMTASGESSAAIREQLKLSWGIVVHPNLISYYRRTRAAEIAMQCEAFLLEARKKYSFASLPKRIGALDDIARRELENPSGGSIRVIMNAITEINEAMFRAELVHIRELEIANDLERSESHELVLHELERRSHIGSATSHDN